MATPRNEGPESRLRGPGARRELLGPRRAVLIALPVAALLIVLVAVVLAGASGSSAGAASSGKSTGSATVTRRDLIATDTESGTLGFGGPQTVYNRLSGTITSLPSAGTVVQPGGTLFTVDNAPVVLMNGSLPAYRTLSAGVGDGPDVKELEQNLRDLGFDPNHAMTIDDTFDSATTAAVERWQASLGQTQTGTVTLGSVVFLPGPRRVSSVTASLGSTGGSSGGASTGTAATASTKPVTHPEFVDYTTPATTSTTSTTSTGTTTTSTRTGPGTGGASGSRTPSSGSGTTSIATLQALVALLKAETAELRAELSSARSGASTTGRTGASSSGGATGGTTTGRSGGSGAAGGTASASGGSGGSSGSGGSASSSAGAGAGAQAVLQTTSTELVATVNLDATKQSEAVLGQPVTVQMPDGSTVDGRISRVAAAAQTSSSSSSSGAGASGSSGGSTSGSGSTSSTVPVTITLSGHRKTAGLDQAAVSINFEQQKAAGVLAVPVTALLATAGGGYAVQQAAAPNRLIPVTTGLFAAGYVQVSGAGVYDGLQVTDSQG
jgi:Putative peptidoglycan binding domain